MNLLYCNFLKFPMVTEQWVFAMFDYLHVLRKASLVMLTVLDQAKHCIEHQKAQCQPKS